MNETREFWYRFLNELGFMVIPYAFNWESTTLWINDTDDFGKLEFEQSEHYQILKKEINFFFYNINKELLIKALPIMKMIDFQLKAKLKEYNIEFKQEDYWYPENLKKYEKKEYMEGFSLKGFILLNTNIINRIDPLGRETFSYFHDFCSYGFSVLQIKEKNNDNR